jgi:hypothetical protein
MSISDALGLLAILGYLAAMVLTLRRGGRPQRVQGCRLVCPFLLKSVDCRITQDVRSGRWMNAVSCSAFGEPDALTCRQECVTLLNEPPLSEARWRQKEAVGPNGLSLRESHVLRPSSAWAQTVRATGWSAAAKCRGSHVVPAA